MDKIASGSQSRSLEVFGSILVLAAAMLLAPVAAVAQTDPNLSSLAEQIRVDTWRGVNRGVQPMTPCFAGTITCGQTATGRVSTDSCQTSDNVYGVGYQFNGTMGQRVTIRASSPSFRMVVALGDGRSGNNTIYAFNQATANGLFAEISDFPLPYTGPYFIILSPLLPTTFGDYTLTVTCPTSQPPPATCTENSTTMCLNSSRFKVETTWRVPDGRTGAGRAVRLTPDTGYFWFFNQENVEMVVKVLNACSAFNRIWVFAGGLTNVEVVLTVTDTKTGTVFRRTNPLNTPYQPIQDTSAFATCP